jgi:hypothetical protein
MPSLTILALTLIFFSCTSKNQRNDRENAIYEVLNASIQLDTLYPRAICNRLGVPFYKPDIVRKEIYEDTIFLKQQLADWKMKTIDSNRLYFIDRNTNMPVKANIDKTCDSLLEYTLSYPLFSKDSSKVLMTVIQFCREPDCGSGFIVILKNVNHHWTKYKVVASWKY